MADPNSKDPSQQPGDPATTPEGDGASSGSLVMALEKDTQAQGGGEQDSGSGTKVGLSNAKIAGMYLRCLPGCAGAGLAIALVVAAFTSTTIGWWLWDATSWIGGHPWIILVLFVIAIVTTCHEFKIESAMEIADKASRLRLDTWQTLDLTACFLAWVAFGVMAIMGITWMCHGSARGFDTDVATTIQRDWYGVGGDVPTFAKTASFMGVIQNDAGTSLRGRNFAYSPTAGLVAAINLNHAQCLRAAEWPWVTFIDDQDHPVSVGAACPNALWNDVRLRINTRKLDETPADTHAAH